MAALLFTDPEKPIYSNILKSKSRFRVTQVRNRFLVFRIQHREEQMTTERIIRAEKMGWFFTNDNYFQWQRRVIRQDRPLAQCFEMCQIAKIGDEYRVCHGMVTINDVPYEELEVLVKMFGYECLDDFVLQTANSNEFVFNKDGTIDRINSHSWIPEYPLLAQMDFKTNAISEYLTDAAFSSESAAEEYIYREFLSREACVW